MPRVWWIAMSASVALSVLVLFLVWRLDRRR